MDQQQVPIIDTVEMEILMHRNAHFGSNFQVMLDYYEQEGVGMMPDFTLEQIKKLKNLEEEVGKDLAEMYLPDAAKKAVESAQKLYQKLRDVYSENENNELSIQVSDLILAEEDVPEKEIEALVQSSGDVVPLLIELIHADSFYDPLFPGYGRSPIFAARALARIGDERAIAPLFEALGHDNFFTDEEIIHALCSFEDKSLDFLLRRVRQEPFSKDNEYAAIVLNAFPEREEIAKASLELLQTDEVCKRKTFASYLTFNCSGLKEPNDQETFRSLAENKEIASELRNEMAIVIKNWNKVF